MTHRPAMLTVFLAVTGNWTTKALPNVRTKTEAVRASRALIEGRVKPRTFEADERNVGIITRRLGTTRLLGVGRDQVADDGLVENRPERREALEDSPLGERIAGRLAAAKLAQEPFKLPPSRSYGERHGKCDSRRRP